MTTSPERLPLHRRPSTWWAVLILCVAGLGVVAFLQGNLGRDRAEGADASTGIDAAGGQEPARLEVMGTVPPFELTDRTGVKVTRDQLLGKIWVADFIFTQCGSICPMMTVRMGELRDMLALPEDRIHFVSISVDPERDTPERLTAYAENYGATGNWYFLTGSRGEIFELCQSHFRLGVRDASAEEIAQGEDPILHSQRFVLVDEKARIRGYYLGAQRDELTFLAEDIRALLSGEETDSPENGESPTDGAEPLPPPDPGRG